MLRSAVLPVLIGISLSHWASAQQGSRPATDPHHEDPELDAVIVTASPLRDPAEQLSTPVEVLSGAALDDRRGATLGATIESLPGVQSSNFGPGVGRPIVRGLEGARVAVLAGGLATQDVSTVSQDHATTVEAFLADQIEVLKGPATLLYGTGAIGGVVNVVDGRIAESALDAPWSGRAELRYDSVNGGRTASARLDAGGAQGALHIDVLHRRLDDYRLPGAGRQPNSFLDADSGALGGSVIGDWGFAGAALSRFENRYGNPGEPGDPGAGEGGVVLDVEQQRGEFKSGLVAPFGTIEQLRFSFARTDYEHTEFEGDEVGTRFLKDASEARVELVQQWIPGWQGALGGQWVDSDFEAVGEEAFVPPTATRASGLFLVEQWRREGWQLDLGVRLDDVRSSTDDGRRRDFAPLSLSAGLIVPVTAGWELYANADHAERAPAEEELFANGPHVATAAFEIGDTRLDEETAQQIELGLHLHGEHLEARFAAYANRFDDFIYLRDTGELMGEEGEELPVRQWTQADARFRGFEAEGRWALRNDDSGRWELRVFGDRVRATLADGGGNLPRIAPARLGTGLQWERQAWRAGITALHHFRQDDVAESESETGGYTRVDAQLAWHLDRPTLGWELFLNATNLGDTRGRVHTSFLKDVVELPGRGVAGGLRLYF